MGNNHRLVTGRVILVQKDHSECNQKSSNAYNKGKVICWKCKKKGHFESEEYPSDHKDTEGNFETYNWMQTSTMTILTRVVIISALNF